MSRILVIDGSKSASTVPAYIREKFNYTPEPISCGTRRRNVLWRGGSTAKLSDYYEEKNYLNERM